MCYMPSDINRYYVAIKQDILARTSEEGQSPYCKPENESNGFNK
jgi:hypothetical protein